MRSLLPTRVICASSNRNKIEFFAALTTSLGLPRAVPISAFGDFPEVEEDRGEGCEVGHTLVLNAKRKTAAAVAFLGDRLTPDDLVIGDDSGLCVDALGGAPGAVSGRWAGEPVNDAANNAKLAQELERVGQQDSMACYLCAIALTRGTVVTVGSASWAFKARIPAQGSGGFGYDPHLWVDASRTVADLTTSELVVRSHRARALRFALIRAGIRSPRAGHE